MFIMQYRSAKYLVVDTSAFINSVSLHKIGENIVTIPDVIDEIRSKRQYRHLFSLTHDIEIKTVFSESIAVVSEFARKTGDYASLSPTDLKLLALTYQLETQYVGQDHIRKSPVVKEFKTNPKRKTDQPSTNGLCLPLNIDKYYQKQRLPNSKNDSKHGVNLSLSRFEKLDISGNVEDNTSEEQNFIISSKEEENSSDEQNFQDCEEEQDHDEYDTANEFSPSDSEIDLSSEEFDENIEAQDESSEDDTWITPRNMSELKHSAGGALVESTSVIVGCLTTDYAIQNVLMQMGLSVITVDGKVIKELRTYILRCYACFKTTSNMRKVFCSNCGNKTLKKVSVFVDREGNKFMFINFKKNISTRGKRFSLPMPKGGKHAVNPRLVEDARRPHQKPSKLARTKTNALDEDYVAGSTPFVMRDVQSKSAQLGFNKGKPVFKYWMRRNPNESKRMPRK